MVIYPFLYDPSATENQKKWQLLIKLHYFPRTAWKLKMVLTLHLHKTKKYFKKFEAMATRAVL
jgi:hypothetical protein